MQKLRHAHNVEVCRDVHLLAAAAHVGNFQHRAEGQLALHAEGELVHPGNHAIEVREGDRLSQECRQPVLAAGGRQNSRRIGIVEIVAGEVNAAIGAGVVGRRLAKSLGARRVEGGDVAQPIAGAHHGLVHGVPRHAHARLPVVQVALVGHAVAGAGKQQPAFYRQARLQGVNHLYGATSVEVEARIDLVVALRDWRFIVPAQSVAEG